MDVSHIFLKSDFMQTDFIHFQTVGILVTVFKMLSVSCEPLLLISQIK
jgi:hypothetical protein